MTNYDPLDLKGQERDKADKELRAKLSRENEETDVKWLMGTKRGRRMLWRLLDQAGVFRLTFDQSTMQMAFNEGNRNSGLRLLNMIHIVSPELYPVMLKEQKEQNDTRNNDDGTAGE